MQQQQKEYQTRNQKEPIPYVYLREIPNKPPPPYKPPTKVKSVLPANSEDIHEVTHYAASVFHKAYLSKNLSNVRLTESSFNLISKRNIGSQCCEFLFNLCTELCMNHYKQFEEEICPSWLKVSRKSQLATVKPLDSKGLEKYLNKSLNDLFGFQKTEVKESAIIQWSRKKRDHVDEVLVTESLAEENDWIMYDQDELFVKNEVTNEIMNMLLDETATIFSAILKKRTNAE